MRKRENKRVKNKRERERERRNKFLHWNTKWLAFCLWLFESTFFLLIYLCLVVFVLPFVVGSLLEVTRELELEPNCHILYYSLL